MMPDYDHSLPSAIKATFRRIVRDAGLPPLTLHGLRHTWASVALDEGVDVLYVAEVLGHSSPAITQSIYQHARPERTVESVERVSAAFS
jgi:integrase